MQTDRQTDRQTDALITILRSPIGAGAARLISDSLTPVLNLHDIVVRFIFSVFLEVFLTTVL